MSSMIHGIRILSKKGCHLTFKTYLIYSDWSSLPRTHGFPLLFFSDYTDYWKLGETVFEKDLKNQKEDIYEDSGHIKLCQRYVKKLVVSDFQNFPVKPEFLEYTWHYIVKGTDKFHYQEHLPQATYELEVTDPKWIEHIPVGAFWETTACDFTGPHWHIETPEENGKFYKIFQTIQGRWMLNYGKKGAKGRFDQPQYMSTAYANTKVNEKLKKGYELIYQNFNTDWNIETELKIKAKKQKKKEQTTPNTEQIFKAIEKHDFAKVEKLLSGNVDPNTLRNKWDSYALEEASEAYGATENSYKITKLLLEKGANPNLGAYGPFFPGHCYSYWENPWQEKIIQLFLDNGVDITLIGGTDQHSLLQTATVSGRIELLKKCIDAGMDAMHRSAQGHTALHYAAQNKRNTIEIIDLLLDQGANINDNNGSWGTPLHFAATRGTKEATMHLVKKGADINLKDTEGKQPIHLVAEYGEDATLEAFLTLGANPDAETNNGVKPLELIIGRILGFNPNITKTALSKLNIFQKHKTISWQDSKLTDALLGKSKSKSKLSSSEEAGLIELIDLGFNPFLQDKKGFNLFHFAAKTQNLDLVKACLNVANAEVNLQDEYGWTAMHYAKSSKNESLINQMLQLNNQYDHHLPSKKQRKIYKVKYPKGTTTKSM